jgi:hypothetical protein
MIQNCLFYDCTRRTVPPWERHIGGTVGRHGAAQPDRCCSRMSANMPITLRWDWLRYMRGI